MKIEKTAKILFMTGGLLVLGAGAIGGKDIHVVIGLIAFSLSYIMEIALRLREVREK